MALPKPLARIVPSLARSALGKGRSGLGALMLDWPEIVGTDVAAQAWPDKISRNRGGGADLTLVVESGAAALEVQHRLEQVRQRVNLYLGRGVVERVKLRQGTLPRRKERFRRERHPLTAKDRREIAAVVDKVPDGALHDALEQLGRAVHAASPSPQSAVNRTSGTRRTLGNGRRVPTL